MAVKLKLEPSSRNLKWSSAFVPFFDFWEPGVARHVEFWGWSAAMPIFKFLVLAGVALIALLFVANATLEPGSSPIVTSQRSGLPEARHPDATQILTSTPAPAPDMTSQAVLAARPKSVSEDLAEIGSAAHKVRAEAPHRRVTQSIGYRQTRSFDRFSIKGY
jgi:hypothetical protein